MAANRNALSNRYYCVECSQAGRKTRVYPFDSYEVLTEAPEPGRSGKSIMLHSQNGGKDYTKLAWCWYCDAMRVCEKITQYELKVMYLTRQGVTLRAGTKSMRDLLEALEEARARRI